MFSAHAYIQMMTMDGMDVLINLIGNVYRNQIATLYILNNHNFLSVKYFSEDNQDHLIGHCFISHILVITL